MKKKVLLSLALGLLLTLLLCGTAMAGTPDWPCLECYDTEKGYTNRWSREGWHTPICNN